MMRFIQTRNTLFVCLIALFASCAAPMDTGKPAWHEEDKQYLDDMYIIIKPVESAGDYATPLRDSLQMAFEEIDFNAKVQIYDRLELITDFQRAYELQQRDYDAFVVCRPTYYQGNSVHLVLEFYKKANHEPDSKFYTMNIILGSDAWRGLPTVSFTGFNEQVKRLVETMKERRMFPPDNVIYQQDAQ